MPRLMRPPSFRFAWKGGAKMGKEEHKRRLEIAMRSRDIVGESALWIALIFRGTGHYP